MRGKSITDACMGWDATVSALDELAHAVATGSVARVGPQAVENGLRQ